MAYIGIIPVHTRLTMLLARQVVRSGRSLWCELHNTQILLAKRLGKKRIIAETGAGQHGVATATVCARFGLQCVVYMGAEDVRRQALNVFRMKMLGATVSYQSLDLASFLDCSFPRLFQSSRDPGHSRTQSTMHCVTG